jgi:hypothetical protein
MWREWQALFTTGAKGGCRPFAVVCLVSRPYDSTVTLAEAVLSMGVLGARVLLAMEGGY